MPEITIHIFEASEGGYMYDIYLADPKRVIELDDAFDGGHCTGSLADCLTMLQDQVLDAVKSREDLPFNQRSQ